MSLQEFTGMDWLKADNFEYQYPPKTILVRRYMSGRYMHKIFCWNDFGMTFETQWVRRLKTAFQKTLTFYPPLAGRLIDNGDKIALNNAACSFRVQRLDGSINDISNINFNGKYVDIENPKEVLNGEGLLTILITVFSDGSVSLGLGMARAICDEKGMDSFISTWDAFMKGEEPSRKDTDVNFEFAFSERFEKELSGKDLHRAVKSELGWRRYPAYLEKMIFKSIAKESTQVTKKRRLAITFKKEEVVAIQEAVTVQMKTEGHTDPCVSIGEAFTAYVLHALMDAFRVPRSSRKKQGLCLPLDLRGRIEGVPSNYWGPLASRDFNLPGLDFSGDWTQSAIQIHDKTREFEADGKKLGKSWQLQTATEHNNELWVDKGMPQFGAAGFLSKCSFNADIESSKGGNSSSITFGLENPVRIVHANLGEHFKVCNNIDGDFELYLSSETMHGVNLWVLGARKYSLFCLFVLFWLALVALIVMMVLPDVTDKVPVLVICIAVMFLSVIGFVLLLSPASAHKRIQQLPGKMLPAANGKGKD
eukprot:gene635-230_t